MSTINFPCEDCGQQLLVQEEHVGRRVRCTSCRNIMVVPSPGRSTPVKEPPPQSYRTSRSGSPLPRSEQRDSLPDDFDVREERERPSRGRGYEDESEDYDDRRYDDRRRDDDYDDFEDRRRRDRDSDGLPRPRRRRRKTPSKNPAGTIALIALVLLLLGGIGAGIWYAFSGGIEEDVALVPDDATMMVSMRPADLWNSHWGKVLREKIGEDKIRQGLENDTKLFGLGIENMDRVTLFFDQKELDLAGPPPPATFVVRTVKNFEKAKILAAFEDNGGKSSSASYKDKQYQTSGGNAIYFHSENIFVFGSEEGVKRSIATTAGGSDTEASDAIKNAKVAASDDQFQLVVGIQGNLGDQIQALGRQNPLLKELNTVRGLPGGAGRLGMDSITGMHVAVGMKSDVIFSMSMSFESTSTAKTVYTQQKRSLDTLETTMKQGLREPGGTAEQRKLVKGALDVIQDIDVDRSGKTVSLEVEIDKSFIDLVVESRNLLPR